MEGEVLVPLLGPADGPLGTKQQELVALVVLHQLHVGAEDQILLLDGLAVVGLDPPQVFVGCPPRPR